MFYLTHGKRVDIFNKRPRNMSTGGMVKDSPKIRDKSEDTVSSLLEYGSLVVPKKVMLSGVMDGYKGRITGQKQLRMAELGKTIIQPGELIVNKKYAPAVENYLLKKGIRLPLGK